MLCGSEYCRLGGKGDLQTGGVRSPEEQEDLCASFRGWREGTGAMYLSHCVMVLSEEQVRAFQSSIEL